MFIRFHDKFTLNDYWLIRLRPTHVLRYGTAQKWNEQRRSRISDRRPGPRSRGSGVWDCLLLSCPRMMRTGPRATSHAHVNPATVSEEGDRSPNNGPARASIVSPVSARRENSTYVAVKNLLNFARIQTRVFWGPVHSKGRPSQNR